MQWPEGLPGWWFGFGQLFREETQQLAGGLWKGGRVDGKAGGRGRTLRTPKEFDEAGIPATQVRRIKGDRMAGRAVGQAIGGKFRDTPGLRYPVASENEDVALLGVDEFPSRGCSRFQRRLVPALTNELKHLVNETYTAEGNID